MKRDEFSLIDTYFKKPARKRDDVIFGIGDDAAAVKVDPQQELLISTDTLVAEVHFLSRWDPYDIAYRAVMVNVSDLAAMAAEPCWASLALTMPEYNTAWLERFAEGLHQALGLYNISLIGGDTTKGPLCITLTLHGLAPKGKSVRRNGAKPSDIIWVSGELGGAALALSKNTEAALMEKLLHPKPRVDLIPVLRAFATAAIDISDGLSADLMHICEASGVGAKLDLTAIPVHPLVSQYLGEKALDFSLSQGDDYELCFTTPKDCQKACIELLKKLQLDCYPIGVIEEKYGLRGLNAEGEVIGLEARGYSHF